MVTFLLCPHVASPLCVQTQSACGLLFLQEHLSLRLESTLMPSFNLKYLLKDPISKQSHIGSRGSTHRVFFWGGHNSVHNRALSCTVSCFFWLKYSSSGCMHGQSSFRVCMMLGRSPSLPVLTACPLSDSPEEGLPQALEQ